MSLTKQNDIEIILILGHEKKPTAPDAAPVKKLNQNVGSETLKMRLKDS